MGNYMNVMYIPMYQRKYRHMFIPARRNSNRDESPVIADYSSDRDNMGQSTRQSPILRRSKRQKRPPRRLQDDQSVAAKLYTFAVPTSDVIWL